MASSLLVVQFLEPRIPLKPHLVQSVVIMPPRSDGEFRMLVRKRMICFVCLTVMLFMAVTQKKLLNVKVTSGSDLKNSSAITVLVPNIYMTNTAASKPTTASTHHKRSFLTFLFFSCSHLAMQ